MVARNTEPKQDVTLTGATNKQDFPARTLADDAAQDDNAKRVQATKDADRARQFLPGQLEALDASTVVVTDANGVRVRAPKAVADTIKA